MARVLIAIGCDKYQHLTDLVGAEKDAKGVFTALVEGIGDYSREHSHLLDSPSTSDAFEVFEDWFELRGQLDVLTFYFAGHSMVAHGNYYLGLADSRKDRLSTTALSFTSILGVFADLQPRQGHLILDACQAGGSMLDLANLLKEEVVGRRGGMSLSFLGASAADEYAVESAEGGLMSQPLMEILEGKRRLQSSTPYLDLVEVGSSISGSFEDQHARQQPLTWGLNLYGRGEFARNPHFVEQTQPRDLLIEGIPPASELGRRIEANSGNLRKLYLNADGSYKPRTLADSLKEVTDVLRGDPESAASFIQGVSTTLRAASATSRDLFGESDVLATCAVQFLPLWKEPIAQDSAKKLLADYVDEARRIRRCLRERVTEGNYALVNRDHLFGDLYFLPIRISDVLGWIGVTLLIEDEVPDEEELLLSRQIVERILRDYDRSIALVSDSQAAGLYLFFEASARFGMIEPARVVFRRSLDSFMEVGGRLAKHDLEAQERLAYLLGRHQDGSAIPLTLVQQPSTALSVLLIAAAKLEVADWLDEILIAVDGLAAGVFCPDNYSSFADRVMEDGVSRIYITGQNFWRVEEFREFLYSEFQERHRSAAELKEPWLQKLCYLASFLFPDRVPWFREFEPICEKGTVE